MKTPLPVLALLLPAALAVAGDAQDHPLPPEPAHGAAITPAEFLWESAWLSDDARGGRDTGSPECAASAAFIAGRMKAMGLEAPEGAPGYLRPWEYESVTVDSECVLEVTPAGGQPRSFAPGKEFAVIGGGAKEAIEAPAVFAGYGITAPDMPYDDYAGLDCKGKIVVVLRHEPREKDPKARWNGDRMSPHAAYAAKAADARAAGALALVVVNDPLNHPVDIVEGARIGPGLPIPVILASRAFAEAVLAGSGTSLEAAQKAIDDADAPAAVKGTGARARVRVVTREVVPDNVCGVLRGTDPKLKDEWIVVGAHYDHVGLGRNGGGMNARLYGQIHNGADDNASGTACMLEVAESFGLGKRGTRRSLLFLAFSGEEKGLLGSMAWVRDPLVPVGSIAAMVNLDMVGRYRPGMLDVVAAESGSTLKEAVDRSGEGLGLEYRHTNEGITDSDGFSFFRAKVPTVFFFTGLHDDYHRPSDDWWLLNAEGGAKIAEWSARLVRRLADADERPVFKAIAPQPLNRGNRVVLGVMLSDREDGIGATVDSVSPRSPAERAGMKEGDRIVKVGDRKVHDSDELRIALGYSRPGESVRVMVLRGQDAVELSVAFPGPPGPIFGIAFDAEPDGGKGALVQEVAPGSVAEAAGVKAGDRILAFGGKEVPDGTALGPLLRAVKAGEKVTVKVIREGKDRDLEAAYPPAK